MDVRSQVEHIAGEAREAARALAKASGEQKARAIRRLGELLSEERGNLQRENERDLELAAETGMDRAKTDRLRLTDKVVDSMVQACLEVAELPDPVGSIETMWKRPNGMLVGRMRIPLGVVAMIYESRPNVTIDAGILCVMAGNGLVLRGGSEAFHSNQALAGLFSRALEETGLPAQAVQLVPTTDREAVRHLLKLEEAIDVVIPRGGEGLIRTVVQEASMPVLKHYRGVCHIYVDETAEIDRAVEIVHNAKVQKPGVCNALECLLVHREAAEALLSEVGRRLGREGVIFKADPRSRGYLGEYAREVSDDDYGREFLDLVLAVRVVDSQDEAQEHIARYGSNHTEAILTSVHERAMRFLKEVDSSLVLVNASTRFNDGGQLGLGAEIGISTSKLHAYGPMGVRELTTTKFVLLGEGQIREG
jgi:glutamate-5-semialdehyde dehydrogenase